MNLFLVIALLITVIAGILVLLMHKKFIRVNNKPVKIILYTLLTIGVIYLILTLLGGPIIEKINAYQQSVLSESEEECKRDDAPFWCNL